MVSRKLALAVSVGVAVSVLGGCSSLTSTSHSQFIEVHVDQSTETLNMNHIVTVQPRSNGNGAMILMDTSNGANGGVIDVTESYDQIVKELGKGN